MIKTKNNYKIESLLIKSNKKTDNTIVMVHGIIGYISFWGKIYTKLHSGFTFDDVIPYKAVKNSTVPIMLIHEKGDMVCDCNNSEEIYKSIPHEKKSFGL